MWKRLVHGSCSHTYIWEGFHAMLVGLASYHGGLCKGWGFFFFCFGYEARLCGREDSECGVVCFLWMIKRRKKS